MKSSVRHQVAGSAALLASARFLSRGFDFATLVILARYLTPSDFGLVAIAMSVVQITETVMEMPTGNVLLQRRSVGRSYLDTAFTIAVLRGIAIAALLCALSIPIAGFFGDQRLVTLICALSIAPALRGLRSPKIFLLFKHLRFRADATAEVFGKLCALIVAIVLVFETGSYWAIASATIAGPLFYMLATYAVAPARPKFSLRHFRFFFGYLGWSMAAQTISALNWQVDRFALGKLATQATVGLFATTRDLAATVYKVVLEPIQRPMLTALSRSNGDPVRQREVYRKSISSVISIGLPIACGQALLAPQIVELVLGPQWLEAIIVFQAVSITLIFGLYSSMTSTLLFAVGKPEFIFSRNLYDFLFRAPATVACIVWLGWKGAVAALLASDLLLAIICVHVARKTIGIPISAQLASGTRGAVSVVAMVGAVLAIQSIMSTPKGVAEILSYVSIIVPVAAIVYGAVHLAIWRASGRPDGFETLILQIAGKLLLRIRVVSQVASRPLQDNS